MGCNFFGLQDIDRAKECFEKVLRYYPGGNYEEDAADFLEYLEEEQAEDVWTMAKPGRRLKFSVNWQRRIRNRYF